APSSVPAWHHRGMRALRRAGGLLLVVGLTACGTGETVGLPGREATVRGSVTGGASGAVLTQASDPYFEGMSLLAGSPVVVDSDGAPRELTELPAGAQVEVWTTGACEESFPVQCEIEALRVLSWGASTDVPRLRCPALPAPQGTRRESRCAAAAQRADRPAAHLPASGP